MPARQDFAKLHYRALTDPRFDDAGRGLVSLRLAAAISAADTARALFLRLAQYCLRLNDRDGMLPGDGVSTARAALGLGPREAAQVLDTLTQADLLEEEEAGLRIRGFRETYGKLFKVRDSAAEAMRELRAAEKAAAEESGTSHPEAGHDGGTFDERSSNVSVTLGEGSPPRVRGRVRNTPPTPPQAGGGDEAALVEAEAQLVRVIEEVHGRKPRYWPAGKGPWLREVRQAAAAGVSPGDWRKAIESRRDGLPWDVVRPLLKEAAARRLREKQLEAQAEAARETLRRDAATMATWPDERLQEYFDHQLRGIDDERAVQVLSRHEVIRGLIAEARETRSVSPATEAP